MYTSALGLIFRAFRCGCVMVPRPRSSTLNNFCVGFSGLCAVRVRSEQSQHSKIIVVTSAYSRNSQVFHHSSNFHSFSNMVFLLRGFVWNSVANIRVRSQTGAFVWSSLRRALHFTFFFPVSLRRYPPSIFPQNPQCKSLLLRGIVSNWYRLKLDHI